MDNNVNGRWNKFKDRWLSAGEIAYGTIDKIESSTKETYTRREVADLIRELINNVGELRIYDAVEGLYCDVPTGGHDA